MPDGVAFDRSWQVDIWTIPVTMAEPDLTVGHILYIPEPMQYMTEIAAPHTIVNLYPNNWNGRTMCTMQTFPDCPRYDIVYHQGRLYRRPDDQSAPWDWSSNSEFTVIGMDYEVASLKRYWAMRLRGDR